MDTIFLTGLSNTAVALVIMLAAWLTGRYLKQARLAYFLWFIALVKMVMPSMYIFSIDSIYQSVTGLFASKQAVTMAIEHEYIMTDTVTSPTMWAVLKNLFFQYLPAAWVIGSLITFLVTMRMIIRFYRLLEESSVIVDKSLHNEIDILKKKFDISSNIELYSTVAQISPIVWWNGGAVKIYLPNTLLNTLKPEQIYWVIAHEMAHVKRKDYLVRWFEYLMIIAMWWNPFVFLAQKNLRAMEEICCDEYVISTLQAVPITYAEALYQAVQQITSPICFPQSMASGVNSGGILIRRFQMILNNNKGSRSSRFVTMMLLSAALLLPFGIGYAGEGKDIEKGEHAKKKVYREHKEEKKALNQDQKVLRKKLEAAVKDGILTEKEAHMKWNQIQKKQGRKGPNPNARKQKALKAKLNKAVKDGILTEKEAHKKWNALNRKHKAPKVKAANDKAAARLKKAVKDGRMSEVEARKKWKQMKKKPAGNEHINAAGKKSDKSLQKRLRKAVKEGTLTEKEAKTVYRTLKAEERKKQARKAGKVENKHRRELNEKDHMELKGHDKDGEHHNAEGIEQKHKGRYANDKDERHEGDKD